MTVWVNTWNLNCFYLVSRLFAPVLWFLGCLPREEGIHSLFSYSCLIQDHHHSVHLQIYLSLAKILTRHFCFISKLWEVGFGEQKAFSELHTLNSINSFHTHTLMHSGAWFLMFRTEAMAMTASRVHTGSDTLILWSHIVAAFQSIRQWFSIKLRINPWTSDQLSCSWAILRSISLIWEKVIC